MPVHQEARGIPSVIKTPLIRLYGQSVCRYHPQEDCRGVFIEESIRCQNKDIWQFSAVFFSVDWSKYWFLRAAYTDSHWVNHRGVLLVTRIDSDMTLIALYVRLGFIAAIGADWFLHHAGVAGLTRHWWSLNRWMEWSFLTTSPVTNPPPISSYPSLSIIPYIDHPYQSSWPTGESGNLIELFSFPFGPTLNETNLHLHVCHGNGICKSNEVVPTLVCFSYLSGNFLV